MKKLEKVWKNKLIIKAGVCEKKMLMLKKALKSANKNVQKSTKKHKFVQAAEK